MNQKEILRYLKYGKAQPTEKELALIEGCIAECQQEIEPRSIYTILPCQIDGDAVTAGPLRLTSRYLAKNLKGCRRLVLLAATLGAKADTMIRTSQITNTAKAAVLQSVFAQQIEEYIDTVEAEICSACGIKKLRPRFSPGYADLPLETQRDLFSALEISKRIGVTLTESCLMVPTKSVTAFIGIPDEPKEESHK